jgi:hypothetical protein
MFALQRMILNYGPVTCLFAKQEIKENKKNYDLFLF